MQSLLIIPGLHCHPSPSKPLSTEGSEVELTKQKMPRGRIDYGSAAEKQGV